MARLKPSDGCCVFYARHSELDYHVKKSPRPISNAVTAASERCRRVDRALASLKRSADIRAMSGQLPSCRMDLYYFFKDVIEIKNVESKTIR